MLAINVRPKKTWICSHLGKIVLLFICPSLLFCSKPSFLLHVRAEQVLDASRPGLKNAIYCVFIFRKADSWCNKSVGIKIFSHIDTKFIWAFEFLSRFELVWIMFDNWTHHYHHHCHSTQSWPPIHRTKKFIPFCEWPKQPPNSK